MYYERILTPEEALYVNRAQQKIAELGDIQAEQVSRNDLDEYLKELSVELQYSISVLKSTDLDLYWSEEDIHMMMDYYILRGDLEVIDYKSGSFPLILPGDSGGSQIWATQQQLATVERESKERDAALQALIDQEVLDRIAGDDALLAIINGLDVSDKTILKADLDVKTAVGGLVPGNKYTQGSVDLEEVLRDLVSKPIVIQNLQVRGSTVDFDNKLISTEDPYFMNSVTWDGFESPNTLAENMQITDNKGYTSEVFEATTGYSPISPTPPHYTPAVDGEVYKVSLIGTPKRSSAVPIAYASVDINVVPYVRYGRLPAVDDSPLPIDEAILLTADTLLVNTKEDALTVPVNVGTSEQGYIAVPKVWTDGTYINWFVSDGNSDGIKNTSLVITPTEVLVGLVVYEVYQWGYRSPVTEITLSKI